ncbi:hypothetical protein JG688_00003143, partial [Phytophthora aleatoria]
RVDMNEYCTEAEVDKLNALEEEVRRERVVTLESEVGFSDELAAFSDREADDLTVRQMEKFVEEFYMAAAMFSTQATAQKTNVAKSGTLLPRCPHRQHSLLYSLVDRLKRAQTSSNVKPSE